MKILVINCGSSSLKFKLFKTGKELLELACGAIERIGTKECKLTFKGGNKNLGLKSISKNHTQAIKESLDLLKKNTIISSNKEIDVVGHRIVHGGEKYQKPVKIDAKVLKEIKELFKLAPLHNPVNLEGIMACKKLLPKAKNIAVFDTAFHQTLPAKAYKYAIPHELYERHGIRKYGFHGTNHEYVTRTVTELLKNKSNLKIISIHLGNGSSITASVDGKAIDTTMGFTPLEGLPMGTRSGSIDPSIVTEIQKLKKFNPKRTEEYLNSECGLLALSELSSDMRDIYQASLKGNEKATATIEHLSYQIAKYIGGYACAMNGLDAIAFTGTMGEKAFYIRDQVCAYLKHLGKIKVFVIKANEEYQIALHASKTK